MTEREIDIADMQCWVFRIAQTRWHISPIECAELFKKYDILGYISECYDLLCTYSYYHVVDDAELILARHRMAQMPCVPAEGSCPPGSRRTAEECISRPGFWAGRSARMP